MSKMILCKNCGVEIVVGDEQEKSYMEKGWELPKYCKKCKDERNAFFKAKEIVILGDEEIDFAKYIDGLPDNEFSSNGKVEYAKRGKK